MLDTALGPPFARFTLICTLVIMYRTAFVMSTRNLQTRNMKRDLIP